MRMAGRRPPPGLALLAIAVACGGVTEVPAPELSRIVARDGVPFEMPSIPATVLDRLGSHRVVLVGERHFIREHRKLMVELVRSLHARGFRQLLLEWPQMADWLLADYLEGGRMMPDWEPPVSLGASMIRAVRDFNATLPPADRVRIRGIDVNLDDYGGAGSFLDILGALAARLPEPGPLAGFPSAGYGTSETQEESLVALRDALLLRRGELIASWGKDSYDLVAEMVDVERVSVTVRAIRDDDYDRAVRVREDEIKRVADLRLGDFGGRTLINVGSTHAQKRRLFGTDIEWLGDYLVHRSRAIGGTVFVMDVSPARGEPGTGGAIADWDIRDSSPEGEIFRLMDETWPGRTVFLPLDDPVFGAGGIRMNVEAEIYVCAPRRQFDALVLLPVGHFEGSLGARPRG